MTGLFSDFLTMISLFGLLFLLSTLPLSSVSKFSEDKREYIYEERLGPSEGANSVLQVRYVSLTLKLSPIGLSKPYGKTVRSLTTNKFPSAYF